MKTKSCIFPSPMVLVINWVKDQIDEPNDLKKDFTMNY